MLGAGFINRLGNSRLVLIELLEDPLEVGIGIGGAGHEASDGGNPQDVIPTSQPQPKNDQQVIDSSPPAGCSPTPTDFYPDRSQQGTLATQI
ncbi:hypothetical protein [Parasynechococcus sp.]|uniref:hypothetical protein n=1 Tax=Parasynechococcus sp. TaxID=3101203 RepID=UPI0037044AB5